jgi:hypothetical protein
MANLKQEVVQDENLAGEAARGREVSVDQDRDTFLPRPSDDLNDPLNWPMYLKVSNCKL